MGTIKGRNGMDLTEAEDIKNRLQECTEEIYKKDLRDPDHQNGNFLKLSFSFYNFDDFISGTVSYLYLILYTFFPKMILMTQITTMMWSLT